MAGAIVTQIYRTLAVVFSSAFVPVPPAQAKISFNLQIFLLQAANDNKLVKYFVCRILTRIKAWLSNKLLLLLLIMYKRATTFCRTGILKQIFPTQTFSNCTRILVVGIRKASLININRIPTRRSAFVNFGICLGTQLQDEHWIGQRTMFATQSIESGMWQMWQMWISLAARKGQNRKCSFPSMHNQKYSNISLSQKYASYHILTLKA